VFGNAPFLDEFGRDCDGVPAAEGMLGVPRTAFRLMDRVYRNGVPGALAVTIRGRERRLVVVPRNDPETGEVYGLAVHIVPRADALASGQGPAGRHPADPERDPPG